MRNLLKKFWLAIGVSVWTNIFMPAVFAGDDFTCDKEQTYCLIYRENITIGDTVGFFYNGKLSATGRVEDILYNGQRRIEITEKFATIYKNARVRLLEDQSLEGSGYYISKVEEGPSAKIELARAEPRTKFSVGVHGGIASYQIGSDNIKGYEASSYTEYRLYRGLKINGRLTLGSGEGDISRSSYDALGYDWGYLTFNHAALQPGLSYTLFEKNMISFKLDTGVGLSYFKGAIDGDEEALADEEYATKLHNGIGWGARATGSILIDTPLASLEIYVAANRNNDATYASLGLGLCKDF